MTKWNPTETTEDERDSDLFFEIADVLDFDPESYSQRTWGELRPTNEQREELVALLAADAERTGAWVPLAGRENDARYLRIKECGTAMCVAGHAANLRGWLPVTTGWGTLDYSSVYHPDETFFDARNEHGVPPVARKLLGITVEEADLLFDGDVVWTGDDLRAFGKGESIVDAFYDQTGFDRDFDRDEGE